MKIFNEKGWDCSPFFIFLLFLILKYGIINIYVLMGGG